MKTFKRFFSVLFLLAVITSGVFAAEALSVPTFAPTTVPTPIVSQTQRENGIAFPNPAYTDGSITLTYQPKTGGIVVKAEAAIYAVNGRKVAGITDNTDRNGLIKFLLEKFAPGIYLYRVTVTYMDGSKESFKIKRFAVVKAGDR